MEGKPDTKPDTQDQPEPQEPQDTRQGRDTEESGTLLDRLRESAANLAPSEIPTANELPGIVGALIYGTDNKELPEHPDDRDYDNGRG